MTDTSNLEIIFHNEMTTEEFIKCLVKWTVRLNEKRFSEALSSQETSSKGGHAG